MASHDVALRVMQEIVVALAKWTGVSLPQLKSLEPEKQQAVNKAKSHLNWPEKQEEPQPLRLLFDFVYFPQDGREEKAQENYCPIGAIADTTPSIPYPVKEKPDLAHHKETIKTELDKLNSEDWQNLSLLTLFIEKYGSCLSFGESDIALIDMARSTAAVAAALVDNSDDEMTLIAGDLSGIQNFIYTISSDGALKSLRARSFYLELVAEEIVQQLLETLDLPRTSVIYAGGGNLYLLASASQNTKDMVNEVQATLNRWLKNKFQSKIFLALTISEPFPAKDIANDKFIAHWNKAVKEVNQQKSQKFINQIGSLLKPKISYEQRCRVCHRDDTTNLKEVENDDGELILQCPTCEKMSQLGRQLFKISVVVRSHRKDIPGNSGKLSFQFVHYYLFEDKDRIPELQEKEILFFINNWKIQNYNFKNSVSLALGNYGKESKEKKSNFIRANEMARKAKGIKRVGYLRMDVDNLGKIFATGLGNKHSLPRLAGLSRQMTYFFKVYLNSLAKERCINLPKEANSLDEGDRKNLLFIYAGGDDLFFSGSWNEIVEFAFDVYQSFRAYTGYNPDITLSGGISIDDIKFPLYHSAELSGKAEELAKGNGRDSLGLFGTAFKWKQWLGATEHQTVRELINELDDKAKKHLDIRDEPEWLGILPFVRSLYTELKGNYSQSFVRNLLITAELQEQAIKEKQKQIDEIAKKIKNNQDNAEVQKLEREREEIRYYLHLPKIAYTLARLPDRLRKEESFKPIRTSLKSPYNALYFRAIATWIELLTRQENHDSNND